MNIVLAVLCILFFCLLVSHFWNTLNRLQRIGNQLRLLLGDIASDSELMERRIKEDLTKKKYGDLEYAIQLSQFIQKMQIGI